MNIRKIIKDCLPYGIIKQREGRLVEIDGSEHPRLFNENGEEVLMIFLDDYRAAHHPYNFVSGRLPKRILWDRYNRNLNLQMYSHLRMLNRQQKVEGIKQFGFLIESEQICPEEYDLIFKSKDAIKDLDALFTHSERLLDTYDNARFMPGGGVWYGTEKWGGQMQDYAYKTKSKLVSIVSSTKTMCPLHQFRIDIAKEMMARGIGDVMGTISGRYVHISDSLTDYMYSVAIENNSTKYYFTEKLQNCFASMTIPIYYGCTELGRYYNLDGVILIKEPTLECAMDALRQVSLSDYESRIPAMIDNYQRVQHYLCNEDYLSDHYMDMFV